MTVLQWAGPCERSEIDGYFPHSLSQPQCLSVMPRFLFLSFSPSIPVLNTNFQAFAFIEVQSHCLGAVGGLNCG